MIWLLNNKITLLIELNAIIIFYSFIINFEVANNNKNLLYFESLL